MDEQNDYGVPDDENPEWTDEMWDKAQLGPPWPVDGMPGAALALRRAARALRVEAARLEDEADRLMSVEADAAARRREPAAAPVPEPAD